MRVHALFAAGLLGLAPAANAQVSGTIIIGGGPIGGVITVGEPVIVARPRARVVYVERPVYVEPRVVYVERWRGHGHFKHRHGYAKRYVYYDPRDRVYYDGHRKGCRKVEVWERDGRYYRDRDNDRYQDRDDERYDDRYDDRRDDRYDDRYRRR